MTFPPHTARWLQTVAALLALAEAACRMCGEPGGGEAAGEALWHHALTNCNISRVALDRRRLSRGDGEGPELEGFELMCDLQIQTNSTKDHEFPHDFDYNTTRPPSAPGLPIPVASIAIGLGQMRPRRR